MKGRLGFVSNSSSSSFLIYGTYIKLEEAEKKMREHITDPDMLEKLAKYGAYEFLTYKSPVGMFASRGGDEYDDGVYIGLSWSSVSDDETGAQFKERVRQRLMSWFGENISLGTYEQAWYNG